MSLNQIAEELTVYSVNVANAAISRQDPRLENASDMMRVAAEKLMQVDAFIAELKAKMQDVNDA